MMARVSLQGHLGPAGHTRARTWALSPSPPPHCNDWGLQGRGRSRVPRVLAPTTMPSTGRWQGVNRWQEAQGRGLRSEFLNVCSFQVNTRNFNFIRNPGFLVEKSQDWDPSSSYCPWRGRLGWVRLVPPCGWQTRPSPLGCMRCYSLAGNGVSGCVPRSQTLMRLSHQQKGGGLTRGRNPPLYQPELKPFFKSPGDPQRDRVLPER